MKIKPKDIEIKNYVYELPEDRIAQQPLSDRDKSKLLVAWAKDPNVSPPVGDGFTMRHRKFSDLPQEIPPGAMLVLNETKVIYARLSLKKATGGLAEVLLLSPVSPSRDPALALRASSADRPRWNAMVGGKNIKANDELFILNLATQTTEKSAEAEPIGQIKIIEKQGANAVVEISWDVEATLLRTLGDFLDRVGRVPLPPYMKRPDNQSDQQRYQTVFAKESGSVAAPTASLHFTKDTFKGLYLNGVKFSRLVLHVGAGTFKPVDSEKVGDHDMHYERISVSRSCLLSLRLQLEEKKPIVAVGTTALRTLESLYWFGVSAYSDRLPRQNDTGLPHLSQWTWLDQEGFAKQVNVTASQAISALIYWIDALGLDTFTANTEILITPGYDFKLVDGLITNYHQPGSTLILLVAAFIGEQRWRKIYEEALRQNYRFLSYGDSSILWREKTQDVSLPIQRKINDHLH